MAKITKTKSRAGKIFMTGIFLIGVLIGIGYVTSDHKTTRTENAPAASQTSQSNPEKTGLKPRDLTDKDRKILGECARHLKTLENMFLEFRNAETFREYGFAHPDYKEWQTTVEKIQKILLKPHDEGYVVAEYSDVYAAAWWLHSAAMEAASAAVMETTTGKRNPNHDKHEREYIKMIDETLEPYLEW